MLIPDACLPLLPLPVPTYPLETATVILSQARILHVLGLGRGPEVLKSIIVSDAVYVVDLRFRPLPGHIKPCQTMSILLLAIDHDGPVAYRHPIAGRFASVALKASRLQPNENARFGIVLENFAQALSG